MEELIIIMLSAAAAIFIALYILLRRNINSAAGQVEEINSIKTNSKVRISTTDKSLVKMTREINKALEEKLKMEAEYKRMDLELRQAIANISHDLRTPLTSIIGYLQLIEDDGLSDEEKKMYMKVVKNRSRSLQNLITGFYDLSRLEAREYRFESSALNLADILSETIAAFYKDFLDKGMEPVIRISEKESSVFADENAVRRVFSNLIQNILRYGSKYTSITLEAQEGRIVTVFENDAPALSTEDAAHLFERFFTGDRTRNGSGTGLGLAITKQLVEQMGGAISAVLHDGRLLIEIRWEKKQA